MGQALMRTARQAACSLLHSEMRSARLGGHARQAAWDGRPAPHTAGWQAETCDLT